MRNYKELNNIRKDLDDAPDKVKSAFNSIVAYFDTESDRKLLEKYLAKKSYKDYLATLAKMIKDPKLDSLVKEAAGGKLANVDLEVFELVLPVTRLMPTQNEIDLDKSLKYGLTKSENISKYFSKEVVLGLPLLTYNRNFIIDGHHRWSQVFCFNPKARMKVVNFEGDLSALEMLKSTQLAIAASINNIPVSVVNGQSIYSTNEKKLEQYMTELICDDSIKELNKYVKSVTDKSTAVKYLLDNIMKLKVDNTPIKDAPKRDLMPQTDKAPGAIDKLSEGTVKIEE